MKVGTKLRAMHHFDRFPRAVQLHVLKFLGLTEQCRFACVSALGNALSHEVTRLLEHLTVSACWYNERFLSGVIALASTQRQRTFPKLRSVTFDEFYGVVIDGLLEVLLYNSPSLVDVKFNQWEHGLKHTDAICVLTKYKSQIQSLQVTDITASALDCISSPLASLMRLLNLDCYGDSEKLSLSRLLPLCSTLQTLSLHMEIPDLCAVLSGLSHPLRSVLHFELYDGCVDFQDAHVRIVHAQLPSLEKFRATFSDTALALCAKLAPNCELLMEELEVEESESESSEEFVYVSDSAYGGEGYGFGSDTGSAFEARFGGSSEESESSEESSEGEDF